MKSRRALGSVALTLALGIGLGASVTGCVGDDNWGYAYSDSEIVFGIAQDKLTDGKVTTTVGYEFLDVRDKGWSARGFVSADQSCWAERLDERLGQPRVEGGVATFQGGLLPANGIAVVANRADDLVLEGPAWATGGEALTFQAKGFAMPDIQPVRVLVPSLDLAIASPADPAAEVPVSLEPGFEIAWTPSEPGAPHESVVASLVVVPEATPEARGVEIRCFFERRAGKGLFPRSLMDRFVGLTGGAASAPIKGKLRIATHRQLTILADGGWSVYVVASVGQREQPFLLER